MYVSNEKGSLVRVDYHTARLSRLYCKKKFSLEYLHDYILVRNNNIMLFGY